ncbi:MAG TPA: hypothetical protein VKU92_09550 [Acidimicrobiales bacterium]|nr:hypothetical protein [Acidimicrobiales bacterium]
MRRLAVRLLGLCALLLGGAGGLALSPAMPAAASGGLSNVWGFSPYNAPSSGSHRFFLQYTVRAGEHLLDHLQLTNLTSKPLTFLIYPSDAVNLQLGGGFSFLTPTEPSHLVGTWLHVPVSHITVAPDHQLIIPLHIDIPAGIPGGDYAGGVVAQNTAITYRRSGAVVIGVHEGIGVRVYLHVLGAPIRSRLAINGVSLVSSPSNWLSWLTGVRKGYVEFRLANIGNAMVNATAHVQITSDLGGSLGKLGAVTYRDLLPGSDPIVTVPVKDLPGVDLYHVHVTVTAQAAFGGPRAVTSGGTSYLDLPLALVLIVAGLLLLAAGWFFYRQRKRHKGGPVPEAPPPDRDKVAVKA